MPEPVAVAALPRALPEAALLQASLAVHEVQAPPRAYLVERGLVRLQLEVVSARSRFVWWNRRKGGRLCTQKRRSAATATGVNEDYSLILTSD